MRRTRQSLNEEPRRRGDDQRKLAWAQRLKPCDPARVAADEKIVVKPALIFLPVKCIHMFDEALTYHRKGLGSKANDLRMEGGEVEIDETMIVRLIPGGEVIVDDFVLGRFTGSVENERQRPFSRFSGALNLIEFLAFDAECPNSISLNHKNGDA